MFSISDAAIAQIKAQIEENNAHGQVIRFAATLGDDRSIQYMMGFDDQKKDGDIDLNINGVAVRLDQVSNDLMDEATLDFVELQPGEFQFIFQNPLDPSYVPPKKD